MRLASFPTLTENQRRSYERTSRNIIERTEKFGERYGNKLRRSRARMIARTEAQFARNRGHLDTMLQAQQTGLVGAEAMKQWVTGPFDVCDICTPLGGRKVSLKTNFSWQGGGGPHPPAHPNCRCSINMVTEYSQAPELVGSNTLEDPNRYIFPDGFTIDVYSGTNVIGT